MNDAVSTWVGADGTFGDVATAPDGVRDLITKKGWKGVGDIATAYSNLESMKGVPPERMLTLPEKPDDADGWNTVYNRLGRPETADKYEFKATEGSAKLDEKLLGDFKKYAHGLGLSTKQFNDIVKFQVDASTSAMSEYEKQSKSDTEAAALAAKATQDAAWNDLKGKRGIKDDAALQSLVAKAKKVAEDVGVFDAANKLGLGDNPEFINAMIELSSRVSESALPRKADAGTATPKAQKLNEIINNPAFVDRMNPEHNKIMAEYHATLRG